MAGKRVLSLRRAASALGVLVLVSGLAACSQGGGAGGGCTTPTAIIPGTPSSSATPPILGWYSADTRSGGTVDVNDSYGAPAGYGCNSVMMTTNGVLGQDKAQLLSYAQEGTSFASIDAVSYWAYRSSVSLSPAPDMAVNLQLFGTAGFAPGCHVTPGLGCFTTLTYEPYLQSGGQGAIASDAWQFWNATDSTVGNGMWWSSSISSGPGSMSQPLPWSTFKSIYTDAVVGAYGFNLGSYNPNMVVAGDGLTFGSTTTDF
jgi:hypothetical protein